MKIAFTWHRKYELLNIIKEYNISYIYFEDILTKYLLNNFDNKKDIFYVGGSDWFDNIIANILLKNNFSYILKLSEKDITWRDYRDNKEHLLIKRIKEHAIRIDIIPWWYIKRNNELIKEVDILIMFIWEHKIWKSWTWTTFNMFIKNNFNKHIIIENLLGKPFLKLIYLKE